MAAVSLGISLTSTTNASSYTTAAFTPAADDLLVVLVSATGTVAAGTLTSSVGGKTFSRKDTAVFATSVHTMYVFVADQLASATSQTVTFDCTGDAASGCNVMVARVSGITKTGLTAILQTAKAENQSASTPATTFGASVQTGNPTLSFVDMETTTNVTEPTSWTLLDRQGHGTPQDEQTAVFRNSGFTGTTITWGSSVSVAYGVLSVEVDASTSGQSIAANTASETDSAIAVGRAKAKAIGLASETDSAIVIRPSRSYPVGVASETDSALAISHSKAVSIGAAVETDSALPITAAGPVAAFAAARNQMWLGIRIGL